MAGRNTTDGNKLDKIKNDISNALQKCREREVELTKLGCQSGNIHFKTERPNSMFILEPTNEEGKRPYVHVGVCPEKQALARERVDRWRERYKLQHAISDLENEIRRLDYEVERVLLSAEYVFELANEAANTFVK